jgi:hypothetical protein
MHKVILIEELARALNYHISISDIKEAEASKVRWEKIKAQGAD